MVTKKEIVNSIWVEKYRPQGIAHLVIPAEMQKFFKEKVVSGIMPNIILYSHFPGTGKTSTAKAIVNDMDADYIYINASEEGNMDTMRNVIKSFATTRSLTGKPKVVIMDEVDGMTEQAQRSFRGYIEQYFKTCRFILTANYINKIIEPLREGRFQAYDFNFSTEEYIDELKPKMVKRLCGILKTQQVEYDENAVEFLVNKYYPKMREMISLLQKYSELKGNINMNLFNFTDVDSSLYDLILNRKFTDARAMVIKNGYDYNTVYRNLYDNLVPKLEKLKQAQAIIVIADYSYRSSSAIDKEIQFAACLLELIRIIGA